MSAEEMEALRNRCTRFLNAHGNQSAATLLSEIPADLGVDRYGAGGAVAALEARICDLLHKPAAVFMPSGTMAQQIALRIHADRRSSRTVAFQATSHVDLHEDKAYERLHGLVGRQIGDPRSLLTIEDIRNVAEPLAAILFELPQREIGGRLPAWDDLVAQTAAARERGAAVHLDGARLWECVPWYGKSLSEIGALFDSVYVSFYKGIGALSGCCLAGEEDMIAEAREWRHRHGGTLFGLWPLAASAMAGLDRRLPLMPRYVEHAAAIAGALRDIDGIDIVPDPPQTTMMHLHMRTDADAFAAAAQSLAEEESLYTWPRSWPTDTPAIRVVELTVGDATLEFSPADVAKILTQLLHG